MVSVGSNDITESYKHKFASSQDELFKVKGCDDWDTNYGGLYMNG